MILTVSPVENPGWTEPHTKPSQCTLLVSNHCINESIEAGAHTLPLGKPWKGDSMSIWIWIGELDKPS